MRMRNRRRRLLGSHGRCHARMRVRLIAHAKSFALRSTKAMDNGSVFRWHRTPQGTTLTIVKDVFIEQLRAGDLVCTGTTRHLVEEWQTVRSVKSPNTPLNTYSVAFGGLTI